VLQGGEIIGVGSTRPERVDVRVLSASNRDLRAAVDAGAFRADLYYRLASFPIVLPPLRARCGDIPLLAARFLAASLEHQHKSIRNIDPEAMALLESYFWPGNVRELQNEIERAVALTPSGESIKPERLSSNIRSGSHLTAANGPAPLAPHLDLRSVHPTAREQSSSTLDRHIPATVHASSAITNTSKDLRHARADFEAKHIAEVLASNQGNVSRSAKLLGISRISLQRKIKEYNLR
jgi:transcriptional regulator with GAF, ATPase, and Fis domain